MKRWIFAVGVPLGAIGIFSLLQDGTPQSRDGRDGIVVVPAALPSSAYMSQPSFVVEDLAQQYRLLAIRSGPGGPSHAVIKGLDRVVRRVALGETFDGSILLSFLGPSTAVIERRGQKATLILEKLTASTPPEVRAEALAAEDLLANIDAPPPQPELGTRGAMHAENR